jgi:PIN domain nuclease of toxin-antitoxin system
MIVLDTQAWLWWLHDPKRLSGRAVSQIQKAERRNGLRVSAISVWEIAVKTAAGKLELPLEINEWFERARSYPNLVVEPLSPLDAIASTQLPGRFHKDPADRMIIAMARRHGASLVTSDARIQAYPHVETVW